MRKSKSCGKFLIIDPSGNAVLLTLNEINNVDELRKQLTDPNVIKKINRHNTMQELCNYVRKYIKGELE